MSRHHSNPIGNASGCATTMFIANVLTLLRIVLNGIGSPRETPGCNG